MVNRPVWRMLKGRQSGNPKNQGASLSVSQPQEGDSIPSGSQPTHYSRHPVVVLLVDMAGALGHLQTQATGSTVTHKIHKEIQAGSLLNCQMDSLLPTYRQMDPDWDSQIPSQTSIWIPYPCTIQANGSTGTHKVKQNGLR